LGNLILKRKNKKLGVTGEKKSGRSPFPSPGEMSPLLVSLRDAHEIERAALASAKRITATRAIQLKCLDCSGFDRKEVAACAKTDCELHYFRKRQVGLRGSRTKAIRRYCLSCCLKSYTEVKECASLSCPLWGFRLGKRPATNDRKRDT